MAPLLVSPLRPTTRENTLKKQQDEQQVTTTIAYDGLPGLEALKKGQETMNQGKENNDGLRILLLGKENQQAAEMARTTKNKLAIPKLLEEVKEAPTETETEKGDAAFAEALAEEEFTVNVKEEPLETKTETTALASDQVQDDGDVEVEASERDAEELNSKKKKKEEEEEENVVRGGDQVVLRLHAYNEVPFLDFGTIEVGRSKAIQFLVKNDSFDKEVLHLDRLPTEKGFSLTGESSSEFLHEEEEEEYDGSYGLGGQKTIEISIRWQPKQAGTTRELVYFRLKSNRKRLQCVLFGKCVEKKEQRESSSSDNARTKAHGGKKRFLHGLSKSLAHHSLANKKKAKIEGRDKDCKTARLQSKSRPGFSAFHTDLWMQKQERAFTAWLNMIFRTEIGCLHGNQASAWNNCQFDAKIQNQLWDYYTRDQTVKEVMMKVERLIDSGKLALKENGGSLFTDVRIHKDAINSIMSYSPFWLKQGLQVILGAQMPISDTYSDSSLRDIVSKYLLEDQLAARKHSTPGTLDGLHKTEYRKCRAQSFLKKFLLMVKLLDKIVSEQREYDMPLMFRHKSKIKSSKAMIQSTLGETLHGEGNVLRHLKFHGYSVSYEQAPLLEFNFKIDNLAVDLRDGVRLSKLVDYMNNKREDLIAKARLSSNARAVRISNTEKVFAQMRKLGISLNGVMSKFGLLDLKPKDIVEGDQELTLQLLWRVMRDWQIPRLVRSLALEVEIDRIRGTQKLDDSFFQTDECLSAHAGVRPIGLLLKWAQAICAKHGLKIQNFTSSFADGYAFCLIFNHYLPAMLSLENVSKVDEDDLLENRPKTQEEIQQVRANFSAMSHSINQLGALPKMLSYSDFDSHGPDENCVISFLAFLASRMMQFSSEERSAILIQRKWREPNAKIKPLQNLQKWIQSAKLIENHWILYKKHIQETRWYKERLQAATKIQASYRMHLQSVQFKKDMSNVVKSQSMVRTWLVKQSLMKQNEAALTIQSSFRSFMVRKYCQDAHGAATKIQASYRMHLQSVQFKKDMSNVVKSQSMVRTWLVKQSLMKQNEAALTIQSSFRSFMVRKYCQDAHGAATKIQASYRMHLQSVQFKKDMSNVVKSQSMVRTWLVKQSLMKQNEAALTIQSSFRSFMVRKYCQDAHGAATKIQASYRMHLQSVQFKKDMSNVVKSQSMVRTWLVKQSLMKQNEAALTIQSSFRSFMVRKYCQDAHGAATKIQASYRMHLQSVQFKRDMSNVVKSQSMVRTWLVKQSLMKQNEAALTIQSSFRSFMVRKYCQDAHGAATKIQASYRMHLQSVQFKRDMSNVVKSQSMVRTWLVKQSLMKQNGAALTIQSSFRSFMVRKYCQDAHGAATKIQASYRMHLQSVQFKKDMSNVVKSQSMVRTWLVKQSLMKQNEAALTIQSSFRSFMVRKYCQDAHGAATKIQASYRTHLQSVQFKKDMSNVVKSQSMVRTWLVKQSLMKQNEAALTIQSSFRSFMVRKYCQDAHGAATKIQASYRMHLQSVQFKKDMSNVVKSQSMVRTWLVKQSLMKQNEAALTIQSSFRSFMVRKYCQDAHGAATKIQASYRMHLQSVQFKKDMSNVVKSQSMVRTWLVKQSLMKQNEAALTIQSSFRSFMVRKYCQDAHGAATKIQASYRMHLQSVQFKKDMSNVVKSQSMVRTWLVKQSLMKQNEAALTIQSSFRSFMVRKYCQDAHGAATKIQASYRMHLQSVQFKKDMSNVVKSQSMVRTWLVKQSLMKQKDAVGIIESYWSEYIFLKKAKIERRAVLIQSMYRGYSARRLCEEKMDKIVIIQKYYRGWKCKRRYQKYMKMKKAMKDFATAAKLFTVKSAAAIKIQSNFRSFVCKRKLQHLEMNHNASRKIQAHWRGYLEGKRYRNILEARKVLRKWVPFIRDRTHFLQMKKAAVLIQSAYKKHYQRRVEGVQIIQNYARSLIAKRKLRESKNSILKIQSLFRSYKTRCSSSKKLKSIRIRLADATVRVEANPKLSIGYQTSTALKGLLKARSVQSAISLCKVVEFSTKYSPECSMMLCDSQNAIIALLRFMRSCNRSEPHVDFLRRVLATLRNVIAWDACLSEAQSPMIEKLGAIPDIFTALSELLQMFRGNQDVFLPAAQVLQALVSKKDTAQMESGEFDGMKRKLEGISQILRQKLRLEKKYIDHMENKKGSDVSARESAKKVLQITSDLQSLCSILNCFDGTQVECFSVDPQKARNTIVRKAFRETSNLL